MVDEVDDVRLTLRLPAKLRDQITVEASRSGRSLNAEIVRRLEDSLASGGEQALWDNLNRLEETLKEVTERLQKLEPRVSYLWDKGQS